MKVYGFVPAKGSSDRVKNKNLRFLNGERLYIRALKILLKCKHIDKVFVDTESEEMFRMADYLPISFMKRDPALASNTTDGHQLLLNEIAHNGDADIYVQLLCTSPFITPETIDNAILELKKNANFDSALLMKKDKYYFWENGKPLYDANKIPNSIDLPETTNEAMGLYVIRKDAAIKAGRRYGERPLFIYGSLEELIDINNDEDLAFAEIYSCGITRQENKRLSLIKHFISSSALSDLLDDMKVEKNETCGAVLSGFQCNLNNSKVLGRANTLRLRALKDGESYKGIYDSLQSYEQVVENDVIVVENEISDYAYFGDLNARMALRSGASAAIINGATRDRKATAYMNFPVFCKSYNAADVRGRATLDFINKPIKIDNVIIHPKDLIFADECAVVVIYQKYEEEVISRVLKTFSNEKDIVMDIMENKEVEAIVEERGAF